MVTASPQSHVSIGAIRVTYLPDGYLLLKPAVVFPTSLATDWSPYTDLLNADGLVVGSMGSHLIQTAERTILIDAGCNQHVDAVYGVLDGYSLLESLAQAGLTPDDVDTVFITHFHIDHVGWIGQDQAGKRVLTFPHARYLTHRAEWQQFADPAVSRSGVADAVDLLQQRIELVEDGEQIAPGVTVLATPGHTVGHSSLQLSSGSERLLILGDTLHCLAQFDHPDWTCYFDDDAELAKVSRKRVLQELAQADTIGCGNHFPNTTFGRWLAHEDKHRWQPQL